MTPSLVNFIVFGATDYRGRFFSVQNYVTTLTGIGWGILIHGEAHSLWIWLALVLLFFGLALVIAGSLKTQARP